MTKIFTTLLLFFLFGQVPGQDFVSIGEDEITLQNGYLSRILQFEEGRFVSSGLFLTGNPQSYIGESADFSCLVNDRVVNGYSAWSLVKSERIQDEQMGEGVRITLESREEPLGLQVELNYLLYPNMPVIRKWIGFRNRGQEDLKIEALNVEDVETSFSHVRSVVHHNYARMKQIGRFVGDWDDPVVVVHDQTLRMGMAIGNEAPGILKRTAFHTRNNNVEAGLSHPGQDFPFRKWLAPGESWESPLTFICLYKDTDNGFDVVDGTVNDFVRRYMQPQIIRREEKPVFVYNTWNPFRTFVSDSLVRDVAKAAADCGVMEFIIDDGWQVNSGAGTSAEAWGNNYGDWLVDGEKFPLGLKSTFDYIDSLGMKPGLWMSIGSATNDAAVYRDHPEWFVKNVSMDPGNLHSSHDADFHTSCFGTGWVDYIRDVVIRLCNEYGLAYTKLDFAIAASAYVNDPQISGCYATDHPLHRDREESYIVIYEQLMELFDELHAAHPNLFIDCTFETAGKLQLMDYAIAGHADGNWLSNFEEPSPTGPLRIRQMAWWRTPAVPAGSLVIGNSAMDDPDFEFALKSLIGTLPIVLGDPRKIPEEGRARILTWSLWMQSMQAQYDYMSYRRDLPGFGEPSEGSWDGWMRINNDSQAGGIIGVFRQGALEGSRQVFLKGIDPEAEYVVKLAPGGDEVHRASGQSLMEAGFRVEIPGQYDGKIFEVRAL